MSKTVVHQPKNANIFFHILTGCNLKCLHCGITESARQQIMLDIKTIKKWLPLFIHPKWPTNLVFLGGEPTLHPNLAEAIKAAKKAHFRSVSINTNGFLFNDILNRVTPKELDRIKFSLDGATSLTNDRIRGRESFRACQKGISQAIKKKFGVSVHFTASRLNKKEIRKMPKLLNQLGVRELSIGFVGVRGGARKIAKVQLTREEWKEAIGQLKKEAGKFQVKLVFPKIFLSQEEKFICAGKCSFNLNVLPNGAVFRCPLGVDTNLNFAQIINNRLIKIINRPTEENLFELEIPWGCPISKLIHPDNVNLNQSGLLEVKIGCCLIKELLFLKTQRRV